MLETMTVTPVIWLNIALFPAEGLPISAICLGMASCFSESEGASGTAGHNESGLFSVGASLGAVSQFFKKGGIFGICV
jgi:hypothetical protein